MACSRIARSSASRASSRACSSSSASAAARLVVVGGPVGVGVLEQVAQLAQPRLEALSLVLDLTTPGGRQRDALAVYPLGHVHLLWERETGSAKYTATRRGKAITAAASPADRSTIIR